MSFMRGLDLCDGPYDTPLSYCVLSTGTVEVWQGLYSRTESSEDGTKESQRELGSGVLRSYKFS
jgi:hypothetical protein